MIKKIMIALATLALAFSMMVLGSKPASAGVICDTTGVCGTIDHATDAGYDNPITIRCDYGNDDTKHWVYEGQSSKRYCKDTDQVYVHTNEEIWCNDGKATAYQYVKTFDALGWHKINDLFSMKCVVQRD